MDDVVTALNPVCGQSMSVAVLVAKSLQGALIEYDGDQYLTGFGQRFQTLRGRRCAVALVAPAGADYAVPGATGDEPSPEQIDLSSARSSQPISISATRCRR
jgi:hypothetical protein